MRLITNEEQELDRALKDQKPGILIKYANKIKRLVKNKYVFTQRDGQQETAYVVTQPKSAGGTIYTVPLMKYCRDKKSKGKEMSSDEFRKFVRDGGKITG